MQQYSLKLVRQRVNLHSDVGTPDGVPGDALSNNEFAMIPEAPKAVAPHLRSIIETQGVFGISHTYACVPTKGRPEHVALTGTCWHGRLW